MVGIRDSLAIPYPQWQSFVSLFTRQQLIPDPPRDDEDGRLPTCRVRLSHRSLVVATALTIPSDREDEAELRWFLEEYLESLASLGRVQEVGKRPNHYSTSLGR